MSNIQIILSRDIYQDNVVEPVTLTNPLYVGDNLAQRVRFRVFRRHGDIAPVDMSSLAIRAYFARPDGGTVMMDGVSGKEWSYVDLPAACYAYPGTFDLVIKSVADTAETTIMRVMGELDKPVTGTIVDPGTDVGNIEEIVEAFLDIENAKNTCVESAGTASSAAETASAAADAASADAQTASEEAASAQESAQAAGDSAANASESETSASGSAAAAAASETNAAGSATEAAGSAADAAASKAAAQAAQTAAQAAQAAAETAASEEVADWLAAHVNPETGYVLDNTLAIQGAAADAKAAGDAIGDLKSAIDITSIPITWDANSEGKYIGATGAIGSSPDFHYSDLLFVGAGNAEFSFNYSGSQMAVRIHGYDEDGNWVRQLAYAAQISTGRSLQFTITSDISYIRISIAEIATNLLLFASLASAVQKLDNDIKIFNTPTITWDSESTDKYIGADGTIGSSSGFHYSNLLRVYPGYCKVSFSYSGPQAGVRIHGYDANGVWLQQLAYKTSITTGQTLIFNVTSNIVCIRISIPAIASDVYCLNKSDIKTSVVALYDLINNEPQEATHWAGKIWYAYGTSLTSTSQGKYANYLAQFSGMQLKNKGIPGGGITDLGGTSRGQVKAAIMNTTDGKTNADLITWEVGANEVGTIDDINDLYDTSDNTFCGCFNQCIRYLMENTTAQIVVMYSPSGKSDPATVKWYHERKEIVRRLCQMNGVYYIGEPNMFGYGRMKNGDYNVDTIHQNDIGGYNLAQFMWEKIKDIPLWYTSVPT